MGCATSKLGEEKEEVVGLCKDRKRLLKSAVDRRYTLADAHCRYFHSLYAVAAAMRLFATRHASPSSSFQITFPPPCPSSPPTETLISNPMFLQQKPSESTQEAIAAFHSSDSSDSSELEEEEMVGVRREEEQVCGYFDTGIPPPITPPQLDFGWDFFNPFNGVRTDVMIGRFSRNPDDDLRAIREEEGIPELEEEEEEDERKTGEIEGSMIAENGNEEHEEERDIAKGSQPVQKGLTVIDTPAMTGRELLEALQDVEDHFIRAYDSGKDVSRMLEVNQVHLQSGLEEIKENSAKLVQSITWHRSTSSRSTTSTKSFLASSSKSSSTWTELKNDLFNDYEGMESWSHSLTLGRLYAWEKKLYEEVKAGDHTRKIYEQKYAQLRNQDARGDDLHSMAKTRATVEDLYTRMLVTIRSADSISKRIQKLRDEELLPQLVELLQGLMRTWKIILESHETQKQIMSEVKSFTCPAYGKFCNDSHRLATLQLEAELQNWHACFIGYVAAQKAYVEALDGWLSKFIVPEVEFYSRGRYSAPPYRAYGPPLLVICHDWLTSLERLPDKAVTYAMKSFGKDVKALWRQQGEEQQQKRKVDSLAKELDRRDVTYRRAENRILESKLSEQRSEPDMHQRVEYLTERKDLLDMFRKRLDGEKAKHHEYMEETQRITLNGFQTGFFSVFESLTEFSKASLKMYDDLSTYSEKIKVGDEKKGGNPTCIEEGSQVEVDGG